jgi:hypothetical protein
MGAPRLTPEASVLLLAAGPASNDAAILDRVASPGFDWAAFHRLLLEHNATAVVRRRLLAVPGIEIPDDIAVAMARTARVMDFRQARLEARLREACDVLAATRTPALLLKGAGLACSVYTAFADRPMGDLDLLLARQDAMRAWHALREAGWVWDEAQYPVSMFARHHHLPQLDDPAGSGIRIELHHDLFLPGHPFRLVREALWARARPVWPGGDWTRAPAPEDALIVAGVHHAWASCFANSLWQLVADVNAIAAADGLDWDAVTERAAAARATTCVYWAVRIAAGQAAVPVPPRVLAALRPPARPEPLAAAFETHIVRAGLLRERAAPSVRLGRTLWRLALRPDAGRRDAVRPWQHEADFQALQVDVMHDVGPGRVRRSLDAVSYLRRLLRGDVSAPVPARQRQQA